MGGGSGGPVLSYDIGGLSGQGGGRIMPAVQTGIAELILETPRVVPPFGIDTSIPDIRPTKPSDVICTVWSGQGGGSGQAGTGDEVIIFGRLNFNSVLEPAHASAGGGGGWGAAGGGGTARGPDTFTGVIGGKTGAAGGKAIQTNGHPVTWLGGSSRAYGAIG